MEAPETDGTETEAPETDVAETEDNRDGCRRDGRCVILKTGEGLSGCYCLISFEYCVWIE